MNEFSSALDPLHSDEDPASGDSQILWAEELDELWRLFCAIDHRPS